MKADGAPFGRNFACNPIDSVKLIFANSPSLSAAKGYLGETP